LRAHIILVGLLIIYQGIKLFRFFLPQKPPQIVGLKIIVGQSQDSRRLKRHGTNRRFREKPESTIPRAFIHPFFSQILTHPTNSK